MKSATIGISVTSICDDAFYGCTGLTSVTVPDSVTGIGDKALGYYYNYGVKKISGFTIYGIPGSEAERYAEINGFIFEEFSAEQTTEPALATGLTVRATSNYFPEAATHYNNLSSYEDENGDVYVTVDYMMAAADKYIINVDVDELTWNPAVLEFKEAYNKMGTGRTAKFTIFPFAFEQGLDAGMVNSFGDNNGGRIVGNYTSVSPAAYAYEEDGSPVTVVRAEFKVLNREAGETVINCSIDTISLCDESVAVPYSRYVPVSGKVINYAAASLTSTFTIISPEGEVIPVVETTEPGTTEEPVLGTTEEPVPGTTEEPTEPTEPAVPNTLIVAGSCSDIFGTVWDATNEANFMRKRTNCNYIKTYAVDKAYDNVQLKVVNNGTDWYGDANGNNISFGLTGAGRFTVTAPPTGHGYVVSVSGSIVELITELRYDTVYAVGNGEDSWLNGASWDPVYTDNEMNEVAENIWEISFDNISIGAERRVKFAIDGQLTQCFGGTFNGFGVETDADYGGDSITFDTEEDYLIVKLQLDLRNYDYVTKQGAKYTVFVSPDVHWAAVKSVAKYITDNLNDPEKTDERTLRKLLRENNVTPDEVIETIFQQQLPYQDFRRIEELLDFELPSPGDPSGDGYIDINDVTTIQRYLAEVEDENGNLLVDLSSPENFAQADVNRDGKINTRDVSQIQRYLAGFISSF